jgi:hypothetical protein
MICFNHVAKLLRGVAKTVAALAAFLAGKMRKWREMARQIL